jgi:hypothetical protein
MTPLIRLCRAVLRWLTTPAPVVIKRYQGTRFCGRQFQEER